MRVEVIKSTIESKASPVDPYAPFDDVVPQPMNFQELAELFHASGYHARCIVLKASCVALAGYESSLDLDALSPECPFEELLFRFLIDFEVCGNAYLEVARNSAGKVVALYHVEAPYIFIKGDRSFVQEVSGERREFAPFGKGTLSTHELAHLKYYTPLSSYYGLPPWLGALTEIRLEYALKSFNASFFTNFAMPEYAVILKGEPSSEDKKDLSTVLRDFFYRQYLGPENAHRALFLHLDPEADIEFEKLTSDIKDMSFEKLYEKVRDAIVSAHGVPPRMVGIVSAGHLGGGSEVEGQLKVFKETYLEPTARRLERFFRRLLGTEDFTLKRLDITTRSLDAEYYKNLVQAGILTPEEARAALALEKAARELEP